MSPKLGKELNSTKKFPEESPGSDELVYRSAQQSVSAY